MKLPLEEERELEKEQRKRAYDLKESHMSETRAVELQGWEVLLVECIQIYESEDYHLPAPAVALYDVNHSEDSLEGR